MKQMKAEVLPAMKVFKKAISAAYRALKEFRECCP
jgi:hypothetical protein